MNTRNWSIRSKIVALVAVPLTALLALWIFATVLTAGPALNLLAARTLLDNIGRPGETLVAELQRERRLSLVYLADPDEAPALAEQRTRTDQAVAAFRRGAASGAVRNAADDPLLARIDELSTSLDVLPSGRGFIDRRAMDRAGALGLYSGLVDTAFHMFTAMIPVGDPQLAGEARTLNALGRAREVFGRADSLLAGAYTAGTFATGEHAQLVQIIGTYRYLYAETVADLPERERTAYQRLAEGDAFVRVRKMEDTLIADGRSEGPVPVDGQVWQTSYDVVVQELRDFELAAADDLTARATPIAVATLVRLGVAGVLGLTALIVSVVVSLRVGRSLIRRLSGLRAAALDLAEQRLPSVVSRLRRGEDIDVEAEAPPLEYGSDELGQLGHAFTEVQRTAVRSAVDEAAIRRGLNEVFLNIARRSQALLHRQLALLDRMERRTVEPEELEDLFRVDHLATRMRRHAEDLVILAGSAPGRGWRNPVPVIDVIRGAVSEVEDYRRVDVSAVENAAIAGRAVGDIIHLLAELLENATSFSPPHTRVQVAAQTVPNGYAIEIEDRGLGMMPEAIDAANHRLAEPPEFDPADSARLGLFVVSQLSARHGVQVRLRASPYGGVTAVALIPTDLVVPDTGPAALTAGPATTGAATTGPATTGGDTGPATTGGDTAVSGPTAVTRPRRTGTDHPAVQPVAPLAAVPPSPPTGLDRRRRTTPRLVPVPSAPPTGTEPPTATEPPTGTERPVATGPVEAGGVDTGRTDAGRVDAHPVDAGRVDADPAQPRGADGGRPLGGPVRAVPAAGAIPLSDDGLPRRVRQASMAPQLQEPADTVMPGQENPGRSPEQVRAMMSALQAGTSRGRRDGSADRPAVQRPPGGMPVTLADLDGPAPAGGRAPGTDWFTEGSGERPATTWADADTAGYPLTGRDGPDVVGAYAPQPPAVPEPAHGGAVVQRTAPADPAPAAAAGDDPTVVHHGEVVPRQRPAGPPPTWPTMAPIDRPATDGEVAHPERDA